MVNENKMRSTMNGIIEKEWDHRERHKKPQLIERGFSDSRTSESYWAAGVNFDTTVSTGLNACLARSL